MDDFHFALISSGGRDCYFGNAADAVSLRAVASRGENFNASKEERSSIPPDRLLRVIYSRLTPRMMVTAETEFRVVRNRYEMLQLYRPYWIHGAQSWLLADN
jgi:hypothetical protein